MLHARSLGLLMLAAVYGCSEASLGGDSDRVSREPTDKKQLATSDEEDRADGRTRSADAREREDEGRDRGSDDEAEDEGDAAGDESGAGERFRAQLESSSNPNDKVVAGCLLKAKEAGLDLPAFKGYRTLQEGSIGNGDTTLTDTLRTDTPSLVLVVVNSIGNGDIAMELLNPKGWYCIKAGSIGNGDIAITHHCDAKVFETRVTSIGNGDKAGMKTVGDCP